MSMDIYSVEKKIRKKKKILMILVMILIFAVSFIIVFKTDFFAIKSIEVFGNRNICKEEIILYSGITLGNNIFKENLKNIQNNLYQQPYIEWVKVKRKLPDKIIVHIRERTEAAAIPFMGNFIIIDKQGRVLEVTPDAKGLKVISGLTFSNFMEGEFLKVEDKQQLAKALQIVEILNTQNVAIKELDISSSNNIILRITDLLSCKIGKGNHLSYKIRVLAEILNDLENREIVRGIIDMSHEGYPNYRPVE